MESRKALPKGSVWPLGPIGAAIGQAEMKHNNVLQRLRTNRCFKTWRRQQNSSARLVSPTPFGRKRQGPATNGCAELLFTDWSLTNDPEQGTTDEQVSFFSLKQEQIS